MNSPEAFEIKIYFFAFSLDAMVGIALGYRADMKLDNGACQLSFQVVGAADRSLEFEAHAGGHQQRRVENV